MWIVCSYGFFNIVCQDGDALNGLLTIKARKRRDLEYLEDFIKFDLPIEESIKADYRFRRKAPRRSVMDGFRVIMREIDYPKTKPTLNVRFPERELIHLNTWSTLYDIQELDEA